MGMVGGKKRGEAGAVQQCRKQRGALPYSAELGDRYGPAEFTESESFRVSHTPTRNRMTRF
jgi:hypothetical protein